MGLGYPPRASALVLLSRFDDGLSVHCVPELANACIASLPDASRAWVLAFVIERQAYWPPPFESISALTEPARAWLLTHVGNDNGTAPWRWHVGGNKTPPSSALLVELLTSALTPPTQAKAEAEPPPAAASDMALHMSLRLIAGAGVVSAHVVSNRHLIGSTEADGPSQSAREDAETAAAAFAPPRAAASAPVTSPTFSEDARLDEICRPNAPNTRRSLPFESMGSEHDLTDDTTSNTSTAAEAGNGSPVSKHAVEHADEDFEQPKKLPKLEGTLDEEAEAEAPWWTAASHE